MNNQAQIWLWEVECVHVEEKKDDREPFSACPRAPHVGMGEGLTVFP